MFFQGQEMMQRGAFNDVDGLDWSNTSRNKGVLLANKHLVALRKNQAGLTAGLTGKNINLFHIDENNKVLAYHRWKNGGVGDDVVVVINFGEREHLKYELGFPLNGGWHVRFNSTRQAYDPEFKEVQIPDVEVINGSASIMIPPSSVIVMSQNG
jgi:1,4-alpha-glucan branching enzyme